LKGNGMINLGATITQMFEFTRTQNGIRQEFVGTHGDVNLSGNGGTPRTRAALTAGWERGPYLVATTLNYVSGIDNINERGGECLDVNPVTSVPYANCRVASFTTLDLFTKWKISKKWEITGSIANLLDRMSPLDVQTYGRINYNPSLHQSGAVGRYFTIASRYTF
jgi:iron complex outermembrane receptor protein